MNLDYPYVMLKAASFLEQELHNKFPGIEALAENCEMSPTKFKKEFREVHGLTPLEYFRTLQIMSLSGLLKGRGKTVKELAEDMGLKKHNDFSVWQKKVLGQDIAK